MKKKKRVRKRKCLNCGELYLPDPRTRDRQKFCSKPECKRASKARSQRRWLSKPENQQYFSGPENVDRVRAWREKHPGYSKKGRKPAGTLQDDCPSQPIDPQEDASDLNLDALQDDCLSQLPLLVGLIASLTGSALQDDIAVSIRRMHSCGQRVLGMKPNAKHGENDDQKTVITPREGSSGSKAIQLDRSPVGA